MEFHNEFNTNTILNAYEAKLPIVINILEICSELAKYMGKIWGMEKLFTFKKSHFRNLSTSFIQIQF